MEFPVSFVELARANPAGTGEDFSVRYSHALLETYFQQALEPAAQLAALIATSNAGAQAFRRGDPPLSWKDALVYAVSKSDRNHLEGRITLGRAPSNDVVIPHGSVSKVHAVFRKDPSTGFFSLYDAGSRFGTVVRGMRLSEGEGVALENGTEIVLAESVRCFFYEPKAFFEHMRKLQAPGTVRKPLRPAP